MTWKERYGNLYLRFVRQHNLRPKKDAIRDIMDGSRLIFGIGNCYHNQHGETWIRLIMPLMEEHFILLVQRSGKSMRAVWNDNSFMIAYRNCSMMPYFNSLINGYLDVDLFFTKYKEVNNEEIEFNKQ